MEALFVTDMYICMHIPSTFPVTWKRLPTLHIQLDMLHTLLPFLATVLLAFARCNNLTNFHETRVCLSGAFHHTLVTLLKRQEGFRFVTPSSVQCVLTENQATMGAFGLNGLPNILMGP